MPQFGVRPFKSTQDLVRVKSLLYDADQESRLHGVRLVEAWRMRGQLPHAIASTAALVAARLHRDSSTASSWSVQAAYSAAISRFVTGYCDIEQTTARRKSMFVVAAEIGLPASFVEVRHEIAHHEMPGVQRLESHAKQALDWLWQHYWISLQGRVPSPLNEIKANESDKLRVELSSAVAAFIAARRKEYQKHNNSPSKAAQTAAMRMIPLMMGKRSHLRVLVDELCREKILVPAHRRADISMAGAYILWDELLIYLHLHQRRFLSILLDRMGEQVKSADVQQELPSDMSGLEAGFGEWILHIFTAEAPWVGRVDEQLALRTVIDLSLSRPHGLQLAQSVITKRDFYGTLDYLL